MQLCSGKLVCLAVFAAVLLSVEMTPETKIITCCTEIGMENITAPIVGFRIQRKKLPCVRAVIFETTEGEVCSHWKQDWVASKIRELEQARRTRRNTTMAPTTTSS